MPVRPTPWFWLRIWRLARFEWQYECRASQKAAPSSHSSKANCWLGLAAAAAAAAVAVAAAAAAAAAAAGHHSSRARCVCAGYPSARRYVEAFFP